MLIEAWIDDVLEECRQEGIDIIFESSDSIYEARHSQDHERKKRKLQYLVRVDKNDNNNTTMDPEATPRPSKKQRMLSDLYHPPSLTPSKTTAREDNGPLDSNSSSSAASTSSQVTSHRSGRMSPTKQIHGLEALDPPIVFRCFDAGYEEGEDPMPDDVKQMLAQVEPMADGHGIIGENLLSYSQTLNQRDKRRFAYPTTRNDALRNRTGQTPRLSDIQSLVDTGIRYENEGSHEATWNEDVHGPMLRLALQTSKHPRSLNIRKLATSAIDPPSLAPVSLPRRIVDYGVMLVPDKELSQAFTELEAIPGTTSTSWSHTTASDCRKYPLAVSIETKSPTKSWTDGKPQLAVWTWTFLKRLEILSFHREETAKSDEPSEPVSLAAHETSPPVQAPEQNIPIHPAQTEIQATSQSSFSPQPIIRNLRRIPCMPLIVVQGHEWHLLITSIDHETGGLTTWSQISFGSTRTCFDAYKVVAVLHFVYDWAETVWRPWFMDLIRRKMDG